jgi:uncharacterized protein YbjT (DUF2867 family)
MRIAVAGATGNIGTLTVNTLEHLGHEVVGISRSLGVDLATGDGLDDALVEVNAVIDVTNIAADTPADSIERFGTATRRLLDAGARRGVEHHVLLSILGLDRVDGNAHYAGKREQERLVASGPLPFTIVRASQFHDFAEMVAGWTERDGTASIAPLLVQPIAHRDVAGILAETAVAAPLGTHIDIAGPEPHDLVDMARLTYQARGKSVTLVPTWSAGFGTEMAGDVLLPTADVRIAPTTFDEWLAELTPLSH